MSTPPTLDLEYLDAKIKFIKEFVPVRPFLHGKKLTTHISPEETIALLEAMRVVLVWRETADPISESYYQEMGRRDATCDIQGAAREAFRAAMEMK
jgi:hypothetical protein